MKTFVISLIAFFIMCGVIVSNSIYINGTGEKLSELTNAILYESDGRIEQITRLESYWDKNKALIEFTANHNMVNNIGIKIKNIRYYFEKGENHRLLQEALLLSEELKELKRLERFSLHNIF